MQLIKLTTSHMSRYISNTTHEPVSGATSYAHYISEHELKLYEVVHTHKDTEGNKLGILDSFVLWCILLHIQWQI